MLLPYFEQDCAYCHRSFAPAKRGTQRFCSSSCRTTYSRKKKTGTLGQLTHLPTPVAVRGQGRKSFKQTALESGAGALGANAITSVIEYLAVLRPMEQRMERMESQIELLLRIQAQLLEGQFQDKHGLCALLTKSGIAPNIARAGLGLPLMPETQPAQSVQAFRLASLKTLG